MVRAAFPAAGADLGNAPEAEQSHLQPAVEQLAHHFIKKGRKSSALLIVGLTALFGGGGYFAQQAAVDRHTDELEKLDAAVDAHEAQPTHDGAVTRIEVKALEDKVQHLDKSVGQLGQKIDGQEKRQTERHDDLKEELRYLRRRRRDR